VTLIFKELTARRLYSSFGIKGLITRSYTQAKEIKLPPLLWLDSPDEHGRSCPRDCYLVSLIRCLMQDWSA
jgi:hypothetical protein